MSVSQLRVLTDAKSHQGTQFLSSFPLIPLLYCYSLFSHEMVPKFVLTLRTCLFACDLFLQDEVTTKDSLFPGSRYYTGGMGASNHFEGTWSCHCGKCMQGDVFYHLSQLNINSAVFHFHNIKGVWRLLCLILWFHLNTKDVSIIAALSRSLDVALAHCLWECLICTLRNVRCCVTSSAFINEALFLPGVCDTGTTQCRCWHLPFCSAFIPQ